MNRAVCIAAFFFLAVLCPANVSAAGPDIGDAVAPVIRRPNAALHDQCLPIPAFSGRAAVRSAADTPPPIVSFEGLSSEGPVPPDTVGDVGPDHYVQAVNSQSGTTAAVFDKRGSELSRFALSDLWPVSSPCGAYGYGDPIVLYDHLADRWLLSQFAIPSWNDFGEPEPPFSLCIALSRTPDPSGSYYTYCYDVNEYFPDYPKYAVWPDAYYLSTNDVDPALEAEEKKKATSDMSEEEEGAYTVGVWAFDRHSMLAGEEAAYIKFTVERNFMLPCDLDGETPPPDGTPNYFYTVMDDTFWPAEGFPGEDRLEIWEFFADFTEPESSTFTHAGDIITEPFNYYFSFTAIPQRGTFRRLDMIGEWPMWRLVYRNFGTHETLLGNFTVDVTERVKRCLGRAGIRWFELRKNGEQPWSLYQEGTHSPDLHHRWMGSIAMDGSGTIALGYSVSSRLRYPSIRYAVRLEEDPPGTLRPEASLWEGRASQTGYNRWGDYSALSIDPADDATFWYTNEYIWGLTLPLLNTWRTRVGSFSAERRTVRATPGSTVGISASDVPGIERFTESPTILITRPAVIGHTTLRRSPAVMDDNAAFPRDSIDCRLPALLAPGEWYVYIRLSEGDAPYPAAYSLIVE